MGDRGGGNLVVNLEGDCPVESSPARAEGMVCGHARREYPWTFGDHLYPGRGQNTQIKHRLVVGQYPRNT